jgi:hypothetical protein
MAIIGAADDLPHLVRLTPEGQIHKQRVAASDQAQRGVGL